MPPAAQRSFDARTVGAARARMIISNDKFWALGTVLHYYFIQDSTSKPSTSDKDLVRQAFQAWRNVGIGIDFAEVQDPAQAIIRISFVKGTSPPAGAWSVVGRDAYNVAQNEPTMNLGWMELDTAIHEIGHAMGMQHEHQNPNAGIVWDRQAVYDSLAKPPNSWSKEDVDSNILDKIPKSQVIGSNWDPNSIMEYPFEAGLILKPVEYRTKPLQPAGGISPMDKQVVKQVYPPQGKKVASLQILQSTPVQIPAGGSATFTFTPSQGRKYNFATFGDSDTVMVLLDSNGRKVAADDDSGEDRNAAFKVALPGSGTYTLSIRLYHQASGNTAVMVW
jgi:hypothetical protein